MEVETGSDLEVRPVSFDEDEILDEDEDADEDQIVDDAGDDSDVELEQEGVDNNDEDEVAEDPERMQLMMPSSFTRGDITRLGLESLARQELELRKGHANDALEGLRLALGHKALLWRTKVQVANTTRKRTRAWDDIKSARQQVEKNIRSYHRAQRAIINLGADKETMLTYKVIRPTDLKMSGDIVDPSQLGQQNDVLSWFWRIPGNSTEKDDSWMQECTLSIFHQVLAELLFALVYRVNFLRAKARYDRWEEELKIVRHEMKWCVLYFQHHRDVWKVRTEESGTKEGHKAYAYKQMVMWEKFMQEGQHRFGGKMAQ